MKCVGNSDVYDKQTDKLQSLYRTVGGEHRNETPRLEFVKLFPGCVMNTSERTIVVTGFGPFTSYAINASWEAVKELYKRHDDLKKRYNINLIIDHVPVDYYYVENRVKELWKEYNPQIVIHVGVSRRAKCLTIERQAHSTGYVRRDINDKCPTKDCEKSSPLVLETAVDVERLCCKLNEKNNDNGCRAVVSHDAGRYLCEYIFYQSLCIQPDRTLFVHVPDFCIYSSQVTAEGLYNIIKILIENL